MHKHPKNGFTLIELLVVLALIAIISSISFGAFRSVSDGNKRTSCQSNLAQIYKSVRLYGQDYDGRFPYLNENGDPNMTNTPSTYSDIQATPKGGIGLWSLYTYPKKGSQAPDSMTPNRGAGNTNCSTNSVDLPAQLGDATADNFVGLAGYVRSAKIFHCPADNFARDVQFRDMTDTSSPTYECKTTSVNSPSLLFKDGDVTYLNPSYLSYQVNDDLPPADLDLNPDPTYSSFRTPETSGANGIKFRQIRPYKVVNNATERVDRATKDMTVLTWCRFHRSLDKTGENTRAGGRNFDNVLFSDGSVQSLPVTQDVVQEDSGAKGQCFGWQRVPREKADKKMLDADKCIPSSK